MMIQCWNNVKVVKDGETIEFEIQSAELDRTRYAQASPLSGCFLITVNKNTEPPLTCHSDGARTEFHDMCILAAIASKLYPKDSFSALLAVQRMRFSMEPETLSVGEITTTGNVIVTL